MSYRDENGKFRKPKEVFPTITETIKNRQFWKNKTMTYLGQKHYFDQDVRTGICYFCKKEGRAQKSRTTYLHHVNYYHQDYLEWTIEVCGSCHWHIDEYNRKVLERATGRKIEKPWGGKRVYKLTYRESLLNTSDGYLEPKTFKKVPESYIRKMESLEKMDSEKETMSSVSRRYFK